MCVCVCVILSPHPGTPWSKSRGNHLNEGNYFFSLGPHCISAWRPWLELGTLSLWGPIASTQHTRTPLPQLDTQSPEHTVPSPQPGAVSLQPGDHHPNLGHDHLVLGPHGLSKSPSSLSHSHRETKGQEGTDVCISNSWPAGKWFFPSTWHW